MRDAIALAEQEPELLQVIHGHAIVAGKVQQGVPHRGMHVLRLADLKPRPSIGVNDRVAWNSFKCPAFADFARGTVYTAMRIHRIFACTYEGSSVHGGVLCRGTTPA